MSRPLAPSNNASACYLARCRTPLLAGTTAALIVACGGAATTTDTVIVATEATIVLDVAPACPFDLDALKADPVAVRYTLDDGPGVVRTEMTAEGDERTLVVRWSERSEDGFDAGLERYTCTPAGLALVGVTTNAGGAAFAPPVLVMPGVPGEGAAGGTVAIHDDDRSTVYDARHAWSAVDVAPPTPRPLDAGTWRIVRSALVVDIDGTDQTWLTETLWAIDDNRLVAVRRTTTIEDGLGTVTRDELADQVQRTSDSTGPPPLIIPGR